MHLIKHLSPREFSDLFALSHNSVRATEGVYLVTVCYNVYKSNGSIRNNKTSFKYFDNAEAALDWADMVPRDRLVKPITITCTSKPRSK